MDAPFNDPTIVPSGERYVSGMKLFNDRFVLEKRIGRGGMGEVWLASDTELGDERALKFLPPELAADKAALGKLRREAQAGRRLTHPRIVKTDDFYVEDGYAAVAMAYIKGATLSDLQSETERGYFEPGDIESWLKDVCAALDYAHQEEGIIHRDLKPQNIMVEASTGRAMVMDFGIARRIAETHTQLTGKDESGTLAYMSPQQLNGDSPVPADDIYSLGVTIYELLTGTPPFFRGDIRVQIPAKVPAGMNEHREQLIKEHLVSDGGGEIPENWEKAVTECLAKERMDRPGGGELLEILRGRPELKPRKKKQKGWRGVLVGVALALVLLGGLLVWSPWNGGARGGDGSGRLQRVEMLMAGLEKETRKGDWAQVTKHLAELRSLKPGHEAVARYEARLKRGLAAESEREAEIQEEVAARVRTQKRKAQLKDSQVAAARAILEQDWELAREYLAESENFVKTSQEKKANQELRNKLAVAQKYIHDITVTVKSPPGKYYSKKELLGVKEPRVTLVRVSKDKKSVEVRIRKLSESRDYFESGEVPGFFKKKKLSLRRAYRNGCGVYKNKQGVYYIIVFNVNTGDEQHILRMSEFLYPKSFKTEDKWLVDMYIKHVVLEGDILYFSYAHSTYASSSNGNNGYLVSYDLKNRQILWHTQSLVSNAMNFLVYDDFIVSGYGFTAEKDYLYLLNKRNGKVVKRYLVDSAPAYFFRDGISILFNTYNSTYEYSCSGW